jgi:uncharacterized protein with ParB-like and HNH nuclease domain
MGANGMTGSSEKLLEFLRISDKLIIPVYQRNYDWKVEHCKTLFKDLLDTIKNDRKTHFFGGIVYVNDPDGGIAELLIIDGQQRITTVTLLLLALAKLLKEGKMESTEQVLADIIIKKYLADEINPDKRKIKLKPIKGDAAAFERLWQNPEEYHHKSNVTVNYLFFYEQIQKKMLTADQLFAAIQRLQVITIKLTPPDDDPQLVFESMNSTGLDLNEGDKIRNYILMCLPASVQEKYYNEYWNPIEKKAGCDKESNSYNVSWFIRDFLSIKQQKIPGINAVYKSFKDYAEQKRENEFESLLIDMLEYARRYEKLLNGSSDFPKILNASIDRLNRFESNVTRPFLLEVLRLKEQNILSDDDAIDVFNTVESFLFRRTICDLPSNALNKIFLSLANDINRQDKTWNNFIGKLRYVLSVKKGKARFPDDIEFAEDLRHKNIYKMPQRYKAYLFERFENGNSREHKSVYKYLDDGTYSVDHIMPQTPSPDWQKALGSDYKTIHEHWLHRLANLTLTAYNSEYKNRVFEEKRTMKAGYLESGIKMNQYIARNAQWGVTELEQREEHLVEQALKLWPYVNTDYSPQEKALDEYALDDDIDFTGKTIIKYKFDGTEREVRNWVEMYTAVLKTLHEKDRTILNCLADADNSVDLAIHIRRDESSFAQSEKIDDGLYVWTRTSTRYKISLLLKFFALFEEDPENLVFVVKESNAVSKDS